MNLRAHQSTIPKRTSVKASPKPFQNIPAKGKGATDKSKAAFDFRQSTQHSDDVSHCENSAPRSGRRENPEYQEDTGTSSTACPENDKTKPLDEHLPSRFRSTFVSSAQLKPSVSVNQPNDSHTIAPQSAEHRSTGDVITGKKHKFVEVCFVEEKARVLSLNFYLC